MVTKPNSRYFAKVNDAMRNGRLFQPPVTDSLYFNSPLALACILGSDSVNVTLGSEDVIEINDQPYDLMAVVESQNGFSPAMLGVVMIETIYPLAAGLGEPFAGPMLSYIDGGAPALGDGRTLGAGQVDAFRTWCGANGYDGAAPENDSAFDPLSFLLEWATTTTPA